MLLRLLVAAKAGAHCREDFFGKGVLFSRPEARVERGGKNLSRYRLIDRRGGGPAALAGILDKAGVIVERLVLRNRRRGEVQQPGRDHPAAPPYFRNVGDIQIEAML